MPPGAGGQPQENAPSAQGQSPHAAPISMPQEKAGLKEAANTNIHIAVNMLEEALPAFGSESPEGQKIMKALNMLSGMIAKRDSSDLVPAEVQQMVRQLTQVGGGTDIQKQIMQMMQQGKQGGQPGQPQPQPHSQGM